MPLYYYDSLNRRGARITGSIDAASMQAAKDILQGQGLMPVKIQEMTVEKAGFSLRGLFEKRIEPKTVIVFTKQLGVLLKSAVPLLQALELMVEQFDGKFRRVLVNVKDGVKSGEPLAKEMSKYPAVFSNVYVQLVRAGEASGRLDLILLRLTDYLERAEDTRRRVKKAMAYPVMMLSFSLFVVVGLLVGLVPRLRGVFEHGNMTLPLPTQILIAMSDFFLNNWLLLTGGLIAVVIFFSYWRATPNGKYQLDTFFLRIPLISYFSRTKAVVQFSKTLGMLLEGGVNLPEALDIVCNIIDNKVLTARLNQARDKIIKEGKIAKHLKETGIFPNIASYMINTGEQSGKLAEMLLTVGADYDIELSDITDRLTANIGPIMTLVVAVVIGFIMISIFLPIMNMADAVKI